MWLAMCPIQFFWFHFIPRSDGVRKHILHEVSDTMPAYLRQMKKEMKERFSFARDRISVHVNAASWRSRVSRHGGGGSLYLSVAKKQRKKEGLWGPNHPFKATSDVG